MTLCILHIGTEKTGTTAIQDTFFKNKSSLVNFYYPKYIGIKNHYLLPFLFYKDLESNHDILELENIKTLDELRKRKIEIIEALKFERIENPGPWIISSEHLSSRLHDYSDLIQLKSLLNDLGFNEIRIVLYFRNVKDYILSLYGTYLKSGKFITIFEFIKSNYVLLNANYYYIYKNWSNVFDDVRCDAYKKNIDIFNKFVMDNDIVFSNNIISERSNTSNQSTIMNYLNDSFNIENEFINNLSVDCKLVNMESLSNLIDFLFLPNQNMLGTFLFKNHEFFS